MRERRLYILLYGATQWRFGGGVRWRAREMGYYKERKVPSHSDRCSSTRKIDACTETHINRLYARTGKKQWRPKSHREPPVIARKGQNGVSQARALGAEARSPLGPAPVVPMTSREDRPESFRKLARGPIEPSAKRQNGLTWSLIIQGLDFSMPALGNNSELVASRPKKVQRRYRPRLALAGRGAVFVKCGTRGWQKYNMLA